MSGTESTFGRNRRTVGWGFVDQGFSSATNLGLSLAAGRLLGPAGLGTVFLGFSIYLIVLNLLRTLVYQPLVAATATLDPEERARAAKRALTTCLVVGTLSSAGVVIAAETVVRGFATSSLIIIAPWLIPTLVQDYWRNVLFREKRASAAAANDGLWFGVMLLTLPAIWRWPSDLTVMAWWGLGALAGALFGLVQTRIFPSWPGEAWHWFRKEAWPFGKWNAGASVVVSVGSQLGAFVIAGILGTSALGGLSAAEALFGPISLIGPAIALPGLPAMARALAKGEARRLAVDLALLAVLASGAYFLVMVLGGWRLLPLLFGASFAQYRKLLWPVTTAQIIGAAGIGSLLLIKAQQRGGILMLVQVFTTIVGLGAVIVLSLAFGITGAAWTGVVIASLSTALLTVAAFRNRASLETSETAEPVLVISTPGTSEWITDAGDEL